MQTDNENDIDQHITTLLTDILAPTNYAEIKGMLKTVDLLADYVKLENVRTILENDVLFRENRDIAVMALDILRKMHDNEQGQESDTCGTKVVDAVNEALGRAEAETITLSESTDDAEEVVAAITPEKTPEPAEVEATSIDATETEPEQASQKSPETNTIIEIPVSAYEVAEDSNPPDAAEDSFDSMDSQTLESESEPAAQDSGFPGLPDDGGLPDSADSMESQAPEIESELASPSVEFSGLSDDAGPLDSVEDSIGSMDNQTIEPESEPTAQDSGFPGLPDDGGLPDSADSMESQAPEIESELASPSVEFPGLPDAAEPPDLAGDSVGSMDSQMPEPESEPAAEGAGFPGLPDSADSMENQTPDIESELASPSVEFPGLSDDAEPPDAADLAGSSPFEDDPDQTPAFPDDGDMSGSTDLAGNEAGNDLEQQWKQTVQRIKELKTRYVTK